MKTFAGEVKVWGDAQPNAVAQMEKLVEYGNVFDAALMADHHLGYSQPIGGVIAYRDQISPSGVGFDIACGNKAIKTNLKYEDIKNQLEDIATMIFKKLEFGVGRTNHDRDAQEHPVFDDGRWTLRPEIMALRDLARQQLGTIGSGNHYVDVFAEYDPSFRDFEEGAAIPDDASIWVGVHFGSRGLGHKITSGFLKEAAGYDFTASPPRGERYEREEPTLLDLNREGMQYFLAMGLAGDYAYAGRDYVCQRVADILGADILEEVHNHHNFAWEEEHDGEKVIVIRKGATPLWPGQKSFIGGSMCDISVIVEGMDTHEAKLALRSTVHGAGRVMSRTEAKGKWKRGECIKPGRVSEQMLRQAIDMSGIVLRGAGLDESPFVYRSLPTVLDAHEDSTHVTNVLRPIVVCMAGPEVRDPYKD